SSTTHSVGTNTFTRLASAAAVLRRIGEHGDGDESVGANAVGRGGAGGAAEAGERVAGAGAVARADAAEQAGLAVREAARGLDLVSGGVGHEGPAWPGGKAGGGEEPGLDC